MGSRRDCTWILGLPGFRVDRIDGAVAATSRLQAAAKHGGRGRRGWRKLHLGVDQSGVIRVHTLTEAVGEDATIGLDLLTAVEGLLVRATATPLLTRSPSTRPPGRGVRQSSSHRRGRRPSLATARGRRRGIGRSRG